KEIFVLRSTDIGSPQDRLGKRGREADTQPRSDLTPPTSRRSSPIPRVNTNRDTSTSSRRQAKAYARRAYNSGKQVMTSDLRETINARTCPITFTLEDASLFDHPHSDALIITAPICGIPVHRIMVDIGAYTSILMLKAFNKLAINPSEVCPCNNRVHGFNGSIALPLGEITLSIRFGGHGQTSKVIIETFKVMDLDNEYNAIIGRMALYKLQAVVFIFHYAIKFPTADGEGTHYGEQREARELFLEIPSREIHMAEKIDVDMGENRDTQKDGQPPTSDEEDKTRDRGRRPGKEPAKEDDILDPRDQFKEKKEGNRAEPSKE
ncbi:Unknown protein, partial [Striga hermonthica]